MEEKPAELPVSEQEVQIQPPSFLDKLRIHKVKILGGVLGILVLVGAVFGVYKFRQRQIPPRFVKRSTPIPIQKVTISTDKTEYKQGETVKITVRNGLNKAVWRNSECRASSFWGLQRLENNEWKELNFSLPYFKEEKEVCDFMSCEGREPVEFKSNSELNYDWGLTICEWPEKTIEVPKTEPKRLEGGTYRISFTYGLNKEGFDLLEKKVIYSNEFTIKEKVVSLSKNCGDYEMPMLEEEIKECTCPNGYKKFYRLRGAYCATDSRKPCHTHTDCPKGEYCISGDKKNWFCTGQFVGCYYRNPENPEEPMRCVN